MVRQIHSRRLTSRHGAAAKRRGVQAGTRPSGRQTGPEISYDRKNDLPRLIALWPHELEIRTAGDHLALLQKLRAALRAERRRGVAGHWTYDLTRHANLLNAYHAELALYEKGPDRP